MGASKPEHVYEIIKAFETYKKLTPNIMDGIDTILNNKPPVIVERF
jgi:aryl-alcohol dehydrogenase-like predicted oxidoreductase